MEQYKIIDTLETYLRASWGIGPGSSGPFCPSSRHEPGPMGLTPGPQPLVSVCGWNRDQRLPFSSGFSHKPGLKRSLYIPPSCSVLCFLAGRVGEVCVALALTSYAHEVFDKMPEPHLSFLLSKLLVQSPFFSRFV